MRHLLPVVIAAALLAAPAAARATTVQVSGTEIVVEAGPEINEISVGTFQDSPNFSFSDDRSPLTPGPGCEQNGSPNRVICRFPEGQPTPVTRVRANLGAGNDVMEMSQATTVAATFDGGVGNDRISGGGGSDGLSGGPGDDTMTGDERFREAFRVNRGADEYTGGEGVDVVSYFAHKTNGALLVSLNDLADDGESGEGDNVHSDVENLEGDISADNNFLGSPLANELLGSSSGNDTLDGAGGDDRLLGFDGNDRLDGADGADYLEGGFGDDFIVGGAGLDSFIGDRTERDVAGTGNDSIRARDGVAEPVACGPGADNAEVDADDSVAADGDNLCEQVFRPGGGGGGPGPGPGGPGPGGDGGSGADEFPLSVGPGKLRVSKSGRVRVRLECLVSDPAGCNGVLRLATVKKVRAGGGRKKRLKLGSKSFSIAPRGSARVTFKLSKANRRALRRLKKVRVSLRAVERAAEPRTTERMATLRRR